MRAGYGAPLRHLLLMAGAFAVAGWVLARIAGEPTAGRMLLWFVGAVIAHDLVLFPVYATADRALRARLAAPARGPSPLNHVRVPALAAGLIFLVYLPGVLGLGRDTYRAATGLEREPLLGRWLLLTAALFLASGLLYALRRWRAHHLRRV
ncbi:hypothetical protein [Micromonospora endolithica]|uniref:Uncharacterized protein n=1 Tax=Micromonospora endolithica TaxID=230091 RepID=A0A3A9ZSS0_9ACTN|nr:hypothetical protein [Micromonospora endolithica]RKN51171.1 hypothetical protein D7223_05560 [Micromonospora endolithica]TWJ22378.1 hypothetical protein JD76_02493 [Micromonospora endolithica]